MDDKCEETKVSKHGAEESKRRSLHFGAGLAKTSKKLRREEGEFGEKNLLIEI